MKIVRDDPAQAAETEEAIENLGVEYTASKRKIPYGVAKSEYSKVQGWRVQYASPTSRSPMLSDYKESRDEISDEEVITLWVFEF